MPARAEPSQHTIADVARLAGVSTATVSRVLHGTARVSDPVRERVEAAIRRLNYSPSSIARSLATGRTATLGIIVADITNPFFLEIVRGVDAAAARAGYSVFICCSDQDRTRERSYLDALRRRRADGVILAGPHSLREEDRDLASAAPLVLVNSQRRGLPVPAIISDSRQGAYLATRHLIDLGHRRLLHLSGPTDPDFSSTSDRQAGFLAAARAAGLLVEPDQVEPCGATLTGGEAAMKRLLARHRPPFAVFAYNDVAAIGALRACRAAGLRVPEDVSLVGFDNVLPTEYTDPPLTTVNQQKFRMGEEAVVLLLRLIGGESGADDVVLPCDLVVRGSTAPPGRRDGEA